MKNPETGKEEYVSLGMMPITEKNFPFELTVSLMIDEQTHHANPIKVPKPLLHLFPGGRMVTKEDGERVRTWNATGKPLNHTEHLVKNAQAAAEDGADAYKSFFLALTSAQKKSLGAEHEANKKRAAEVDSAKKIPVFGSKEEPADWPDSFDGAEVIFNGEHLVWNEDTGSYEAARESPAAA